MAEEILTVSNLGFSYDKNQEHPTLNNISFSINSGEWIALIGRNGSGKSTLAKLLIGLLESDQGKIVIDGFELNEETVWEIRRRVGYVFQNPDNQFVGATVENDVAFALENIGMDSQQMRERVTWALEAVGMTGFEKREPASLSGGQKQRVAIAGVNALAPKIIILDESTAMLDPLGRQVVMSVIRDLKEKLNLTIISITHDIDEAALADRVLVLKKGQVQTQAQPEEIFVYGDRLVDMGLDVPFGQSLKDRLQALGIPVPKEYMTVEGMAEWLCASNLIK
ncbi:energy-coupling factor transport system ATP-binding protein [Aerococcus urinaehominis]|uniref:energy-coupling factor ABC transporter ATP-binding protein n=1 Tax=Aerococcus urinaehominis TaxID=128944 RepID=UPI00088E3A67|nr:energy-coupling factor ABC transporter ATP-binding protein [Aerococcus urinaehominis]SDM04480.1 energy-coupling factor transport system ATP-binding protein [Aerococcus urinaehominis]